MEQVIANGLYLGAQYALIALGLTLIFALMNVLNFAHGQMYVLGGFVTYTIYGKLGLPFVVALLAAATPLSRWLSGSDSLAATKAMVLTPLFSFRYL
jgi:branched-chain amino acid transport system permease protein